MTKQARLPSLFCESLLFWHVKIFFSQLALVALLAPGSLVSGRSSCKEATFRITWPLLLVLSESAFCRANHITHHYKLFVLTTLLPSFIVLSLFHQPYFLTLSD